MISFPGFIRFILRLGLFLPFLLQPAPQVARPDNLWQTLVPGIDYRDFYTPTPNHLYVARMQRDNLIVALDSSIAQGRLSGGLETVRSMADRYDQAINYWGETWGNRNQVVVAINGSYHNTDTGVPLQGQVQSGWYVKQYDNRQNVSGVAWTLERQIFIGGCIVQRPARQIITHIPTGKTVSFDGINIPRPDSGVIIYTPQYDSTTLTDNSGVEILVQLDRPLLIIPAPQMIVGTVVQVRDGMGSTPIPFDHIVLSASGDAAIELRLELKPGDQIGISQEIQHFEPNCQTPAPADWSKTYASVGNSYVFLRNGEVQPLADLGAVLRNPRTAIAFDERYIYFIVVDGRDLYRSVGMSMVELALFVKTYLGATWGAALDGGGSSTMVVQGQVVNSPRSDVTVMGASVSQGENPTLNKQERAVANGLMMVHIAPREQSTQFTPGQSVAVSSETPLYLGPGDNYAIFDFLAAGTRGQILPHPLNGVLAKGAYWWYAGFGDRAGWVKQDALLLQ